MNSLRGDRVLSELNDLADHYGYQAISTLAVTQFYRRKSQLYVSYAGHPPALVYRRSEGAWRPAELPDGEGLANLPIGVSEETRYAQRSFPLASGDRVLLYTDGVIEAPDRSGRQFGLKQLIDVAEAAAGGSLANLKDSVIGAATTHRRQACAR